MKCIVPIMFAAASVLAVTSNFTLLVAIALSITDTDMKTFMHERVQKLLE